MHIIGVTQGGRRRIVRTCVRRGIAPCDRFGIRTAPAFAFSCALISACLAVTGFGQFGVRQESSASAARGDAGDPGIELFETPEARHDGGAVLVIEALDAATGEALDRFLAVAGVQVRDDLVSPDFIAAHGSGQIVNWQAHTAREGRRGQLLWPLRRAYRPLGLRVEAEGFVPLRCRWIDKERGSQTIVFRLQRDPGIVVQLFLPDGEPAAGAEVATVMVGRRPALSGATFSAADPARDRPGDRWSRGVVRQADEGGQLTLPTETDPSAFVVAVHEQGTAHVPFQDLQRTRMLELRAWARVEGRVLIGSKPGPLERVVIYDHHPHRAPYPEAFSYFQELRSDAEGRFVVEHFPAGAGALYLPEFLPGMDTAFGWDDTPPIPRIATGQFVGKPGETVVVTIGGEGLGPRQVDRVEQDGDGPPRRAP